MLILQSKNLPVPHYGKLFHKFYIILLYKIHKITYVKFINSTFQQFIKLEYVSLLI